MHTQHTRAHLVNERRRSWIRRPLTVGQLNQPRGEQRRKTHRSHWGFTKMYESPSSCVCLSCVCVRLSATVSSPRWLRQNSQHAAGGSGFIHPTDYQWASASACTYACIRVCSVPTCMDVFPCARCSPPSQKTQMEWGIIFLIKNGRGSSEFFCAFVCVCRVHMLYDMHTLSHMFCTCSHTELGKVNKFQISYPPSQKCSFAWMEIEMRTIWRRCKLILSN